MANLEHLEILKRGVKEWNKWRGEHSQIKPDLSTALLRREDLSGADLSYSDLRGAGLNRADLTRASLSRANLAGAYLNEATLWGTDMSGSNLTDSDFSETICTSVDFANTNLKNTNLQEAQFHIANFQNAKLEGTDFKNAVIGWAVFADNDLSTAVGLDSVFHKGPSSIGIDTIFKSNGNIPEVFLRGCGVPDTFITFAKSLVNSAIDYYSAFISYSSKNHDVAERLYADLQARGVRCWFAPEDIKIGDKFRQRIDEAIRVHDKLLVILSEESISSAWVEEEVESALERERRENRLVLFPIRIDDAVINSDQAWAASLRRMRHIGDFSQWKDHDSYSKVFERLLRDLKAEGKA